MHLVVTHSHLILSMVHLANCFDSLHMYAMSVLDPLTETKLYLLTLCLFLDLSNIAQKKANNSTHVCLTKKKVPCFSLAAEFFFQSSRCTTKAQEPGDLWPVTLCEFSPMHSRCFHPRRVLCSGLPAWKSCLQWTVWLCEGLEMWERTGGGGVAGLLEDTRCCVFPLF